jgi:hypothetical protein
LMPLSSMVMTRHIHDLRLGRASYLTAGMKGDKEEVWQAMIMMTTMTGNGRRMLITSLAGK